ncbi:hypothetical protein [Cellulomonas palmilytica]|uniref:hypothetical protein n=1 Tax=Cellulomonas palmilytica TaxID=2608402 RepID=UPI001F348BC7|nr:hypothetical protein [Cellulomonas palmilytica]UJP40817.1 hypothetical protein F1D97_04845 [Cellulomonas palmilytica]
MRSVSALRSDLERLEAQVRAFDSATVKTPGLALMRQGLAEIRDDVHQDLRDARRARLEVVLNGVPVAGHEVRIDALAKLLHSLQESVSSIAQSITGKATARASIPGPLRDATALRLASVYPGSFGAILKGPTLGHEDEEPLFDVEDSVPSLLDMAVETVLQVVELAAADDPNDNMLVEKILPLGARSFKHLKELSAAIVDEDLSASIAFTSPSAEPHRVMLNKAAARALSDALGRNRLTEDQEVLVGHLGTVSDIRNRIELQTQDEIISARVVDELVPQLAQYYSRSVTATFDVTTLRSLVTGEERRSYVLVGLALTEEPEPLI